MTSTNIPGLSRPGIQIFKFQDVPGFRGPVRTLYKYVLLLIITYLLVLLDKEPKVYFQVHQ